MLSLSTACRTLLVAGLCAVRPAAAQVAWPSGPSTYPRDATTLVALPHQQAALGLTDAQAARLREVSREWLDQVHDVRGDLRALREAVHAVLGARGPDEPSDAGEAMALFADIDQHEAEVRHIFREGARAALAVLTDAQREAWERTLEQARDEAGGRTAIPP